MREHEPTHFRFAGARLATSAAVALAGLLFFAAPAAGAPDAAISSPPAGAPEGSPSRRVVVTLDDLPVVEDGLAADAMDRISDAILDALRRHGVPAVGFVNGQRVLARGQADARLAALDRWLDAGAELGNHSHSHPGFQSTPLREYQDDALLGDLFPRMLMAQRGRTVRYYRHPFNQTGPTAEAKAAFETFIAERGYTVVPFTVEHADYIFNTLWNEARQTGDQAGAERIRQDYMAHLDTAFTFAEDLARETFGRDIPQVFLIHANSINALCLDAMLARLVERGYGFIPMEEALADPAYATPDTYVAGNGVSWLHRWRHSLGLEDRLRAEPDPPPFVLKAWLERRRRQQEAGAGQP